MRVKAAQFCGEGELCIRANEELNTAQVTFQAAPWMKCQEIIMTIEQAKALRDALVEFFDPVMESKDI